MGIFVSEYTCDVCGRILNKDNIYYEVSDQKYLCKQHWLESERDRLLKQIHKKEKWLASTHHKDIKKWAQEVARIEEKLDQLRKYTRK